MRLRMDLAYEGTDFHGWASQPGLWTVQGTLEAALATLLRVPEVAVVCAGRTDTGVHARGQVAHVNVDSDSLDQVSGRPPVVSGAVGVGHRRHQPGARRPGAARHPAQPASRLRGRNARGSRRPVITRL